jgi:hypothetical protein
MKTTPTLAKIADSAYAERLRGSKLSDTTLQVRV